MAADPASAAASALVSVSEEASEGQGGRARQGKRRRVAIAVDSSERCMAAVAWAVRNLVQAGDGVMLVHAQERPDLWQGVLPLKDAPLPPEAIESIKTHISSLTRRTLDRAKEVCLKEQVEVETQAVIGDPREVLCRFVDENSCDMLVVGSRGLGGLQSQLLGSVSAHCVHHAKVPVVVVRNT